MVVVRRVAAVVLAASVVAGCTSTTNGHGRSTASCAPVFFGVAGSGQGIENPPPDAIPNSVSPTDAHRYGTTVGLLKTDLAAIAGRRLASATAINYPAIPLTRYIGPGGIVSDLATSEAKGVIALVSAIRRSYAGGCAGRP